MTLRQAYETIFKDILINRELGFDVEITKELANKISKSLLENDSFLMQIEEELADSIGNEVDELADELGLYED